MDLPHLELEQTDLGQMRPKIRISITGSPAVCKETAQDDAGQTDLLDGMVTSLAGSSEQEVQGNAGGEEYRRVMKRACRGDTLVMVALLAAGEVRS